MGESKETLKARRRYRNLLGLCTYCLSPRENGVSLCAKHHAAHMKTDRARREREKVARGYRMQRVVR